MEIKRYEGTGRMSRAVVHNNTVYLCGQTHDDGDIKEQTKMVLQKIEDFADMNSVWDAWVTPGFEPARACVEARMARESLLVEMTVTAAVK